MRGAVVHPKISTAHSVSWCFVWKWIFLWVVPLRSNLAVTTRIFSYVFRILDPNLNHWEGGTTRLIFRGAKFTPKFQPAFLCDNFKWLVRLAHLLAI